ncbi:MAG: hypothetical protein ACREJ3_14845, partial [Polyangiaceae bacterium]
VLYGCVRPGGRLLLGNLVEAPDTSWIMDYVANWTLVYRTPETLLGLATSLGLKPPNARIARDATEKCLFLDITKSAPML